MHALDEPRLRLEQAVARGNELEAALVALRTENAVLANRAAIETDFRIALADAVAAQLSAARDRLDRVVDIIGAQAAEARERSTVWQRPSAPKLPKRAAA